MKTADLERNARARWAGGILPAGARPRAHAIRAALLAAAAVCGAYLVQRPVTLPPRGLLAAAALEDFYPPEGGHRWSRGRSTIVFPDPGPGVPVRVEVDLAGWRPRGQGPVLVALEAGDHRVPSASWARVETVTLPAVTGGWWRSDLVVRLEAETFRPGAGDARALGVRFHGARLLPTGPVVALRRPPLGQVAAAALTGFFLVALAGRRGLSPARAALACWALALVLGIGYVWARPWVALAAWPLAASAATLWAAAGLAPNAGGRARALATESMRAFLRGLRIWTPWPIAAVLVAELLAVGAAHRARPSLEIDLGSGREVAVARGFGPFDAAAGATFRAPLPGAALDLRDFGGGGLWTVAVTASVADGARRLVVAHSGSDRLEAALAPSWTTAVFPLRPPTGWRPGPLLTFPAAGERLGLRLDRLRVERGGSLPAARVLVAVLGSSVLLGVALAAVGLPRAAVPAAVLLLAGQAAALALDPVVAIPFAVPFLGICASGAVLAAVLAGAQRLAMRSATSSRGVLPPSALAAAALGFVAWLAVTSFPLYRGGHFLFQSAVAEEIWRGHFLHFYLPYPGSILSRQEQWGNVVVPNPFLYQTLISPLAGLPRHWFHLGQKVVLALLLSSLTLITAVLARHVAGSRAAAYAAVVFATFLPTFQLLGLGHVVTLFGVWAASLFLAFVVLRFDRMPQRATWWAATFLITVCFLSYTAALFFTGLVVAASGAFLWPCHPRSARALASAALVGSLLAFALYYVHWAWPFLSESLPRIASGSGTVVSQGDLWVRLMKEPSRLAYTFGSALIPLAGLAGLARLRRAARPTRVILGLWAGILVALSGLDLFFNLLHKHHYFTMVPLAAGGGLLLAALDDRGRAARLLAVVLCLASAVLGARTALDAALGRIP